MTTGLCTVLLGLIGCKSIPKTGPAPGAVLAVTPAEAGQCREKGDALYHQQPRSLAQVAESARLLDLAAAALVDDADLQWQAARSWAFVAENGTNTTQRIGAAKRGLARAGRARTLAPDRVEGHFWYAINVGLLADADHGYGLKAVGEMQPALERAIELDPKYELAAPLRTMGVLLLRTPGPPLSIGSPRQGLRLLQKAVALCPDYPENYLYLAEALHLAGKAEEAAAALARVHEAPDWPDQQFESEQWRRQARQWQESWRTP